MPSKQPKTEVTTKQGLETAEKVAVIVMIFSALLMGATIFIALPLLLRYS